jgi:hypothetical protein
MLSIYLPTNSEPSLSLRFHHHGEARKLQLRGALWRQPRHRAKAGGGREPSLNAKTTPRLEEGGDRVGMWGIIRSSRIMGDPEAVREVPGKLRFRKVYWSIGDNSLILHSYNSISAYIAVLHKQMPSFRFRSFQIYAPVMWAGHETPRADA